MAFANGHTQSPRQSSRIGGLSDMALRDFHCPRVSQHDMKDSLLIL